MPIDYSKLSPEEELALVASGYYPDTSVISTADYGLSQSDDSLPKLDFIAELPPPERPGAFGRALAAASEPGNYIGNRAVYGLYGLGSALYDMATGKSASEIGRRLREIDVQRQAEDQNRWDYIMGEHGASLTPMDHFFNALGVVIPGAGAAKDTVKGIAKKALASVAARNAMKAGRVAQTIGRASRTVDEMIHFARGTNFTKDDAIRFLQAAENPNGVRSAVADIMRNDDMLRNSINTYNSIDDTADIFTRLGILDPETRAILNNMKSGADIAGDIAVSRQPTLIENLTSAINNAARNKITEAESLARAAGENLPRAWRGMSNSELINVARDNAVREAWLNRLARQDIGSILPNFGSSYAKVGLLGGVGNALGDVTSDLPYNAEAEARLAEVALSEPTSLKPSGTDKAVPEAVATNTTATNADDTMEESRAGAYDLYASNPTDVVSDKLPSSDDGTVPLSSLFADFRNSLQQNAEETKKALEGLKKDYEGLRNMQAMDPYQWETRVQLERQLLDAEKRASNNYRDDPWNTIGAILTAPLTARRLQNPFEVWESSVQAAVDRDPEVRRLRRLLGYTEDLPSGSDRAKSEQSVIEQVSKVNFDLINASLKEHQKMLEAAMAYNSNVSKERMKKAETELKEAQAEAARARAKYYEKGGYNRGVDPIAISSLLNLGVPGPSPLVENN